VLTRLLDTLLGELWLLARSLSPWLRPTHRFFWPYLIAFVAIAYVLAARRRGRLLGVGRFLGFLFPRNVWSHPDAVQGYKYVLSLLIFYRFTTFGGVILSTAAVGQAVRTLLESTLGAETQRSVGGGAALLYLISALLIGDLSQFWLHRAQHRFSVLWELHKVHHYPKSITPVTALQVHPLEGAMKGATNSVAMGLLSGLFSYLYGPPPLEWSVYGLTISGLAMNLFSNFRHSHIWVQFPKWLSTVLSSPAMHQIHHSTAPHHFNRNFAIAFSLWDYLFGTLHVPDRKESLVVGLPKEEGEFPSVFSLYSAPLVRIGRRLIARVSADVPPN